MAGSRASRSNKPLRVAFDRRIKLEFHGARITSDGGLLRGAGIPKPGCQQRRSIR
jgi:hypothetical protein